MQPRPPTNADSFMFLFVTCWLSNVNRGGGAILTIHSAWKPFCGSGQGRNLHLLIQLDKHVRLLIRKSRGCGGVLVGGPAAKPPWGVEGRFFAWFAIRVVMGDVVHNVSTMCRLCETPPGRCSPSGGASPPYPPPGRPASGAAKIHTVRSRPLVAGKFMNFSVRRASMSG